MLKQNNFSSVNAKTQISRNIGTIFKSTEQRINQKFKTSQIFNTDASPQRSGYNGITQDLFLSLNKLNTPKANILQIKNQMKNDSAQNFYSTQKQLNKNKSELVLQDGEFKNNDNVFLQSKFRHIEQKLNNLNINDEHGKIIDNQRTLKKDQQQSIVNLRQKLDRFSSVKNLLEVEPKKQDECFEYKDVLVSNIETLTDMSKNLTVLFEKTKLNNESQLENNIKNLKQYNSEFSKALTFNYVSLTKSQKFQLSSSKKDNQQLVSSPSQKMNLLERAEFNYKQSFVLQQRLDQMKIKLSNNLCKALHKVFFQNQSRTLFDKLKQINRQFIIQNRIQKFAALLKNHFIKPIFRLIKKVPNNFYSPQPSNYKSTNLYNNLQNYRINSQKKTQYEEKVEDIFQKILDFESQEQVFNLIQRANKMYPRLKVFQSQRYFIFIQDINPIMKNIGNKITSIQDLKYQSTLNKKNLLDLRMNNL